MDASKLLKLQEMNYQVRKVCGLCQHGNFPNNKWGTCDLYTYKHLKHKIATSELSIHEFGSCEHFKLDESKVVKLGSYKGFL